MDGSVKVKNDTWLPAQTALVEVESPSDGLFICTSERVDAWPRRLVEGINKVRCKIREEHAPITLKAGEIIGEVVTLAVSEQPEPEHSIDEAEGTPSNEAEGESNGAEEPSASESDAGGESESGSGEDTATTKGKGKSKTSPAS